MPERDYICCAMLLLCKTALQQDCTAAFTPMQIAFHTQAHRVSISPQQPCLRQITSAVPCCCCAKLPFSRTALLHLHLCLSHKGASSQHQPTASMPGTEHNYSVMLLLCKTALQYDCTAAFTPMQIAFHPEAHRVSTSPQQPCLKQIISAVPCCCCAKQPYSWTALLRLHLCRLPLHRGASSWHQPTATMPETDYICCAMLLLCKNALQHDCSAAFTPMQIAFHTQAHRVSISPQQPCLRQIISALSGCCCAKPPFSRTALLHLHLCLSHKGASSQHQPTASMPERDYICRAMLLLCKTALQLDCTAAFTPMQIAFTPRCVELASAHSNHA